MNAYDTVNPGDGFERWHHATCRNYSHTEAQSLSEPGFSASVAVHRFGRLAISRNSSLVPGAGQWRVTRGPSDIRRDHRDDFFLWIGRGGTVALEQQGRAVTLQAGDLMLMDQARPFTLTFGQTSAYTIVIVSRELMQSHLAGAQDMVSRCIDGRSPLARLGASLAEECMALSASADPAWPHERIDTAALDIWSSAIGSALARPEPRAERRGQRLAQVKAFLSSRLDDADLDVASIARETYMSDRTLLRLFAAEGTTPMRWLWAERLRASRQALEHGRFLRVTDAAVAFGFKDLSHYSRVFKAAYGQSPQQVLKSRAP
ncbi:helix-turn-helix domain-containing protein [Pusillimonas noertemannii]|uniref:AraC-like protein n=1 Tax=Pusillimonas noertemannii TaxID=305977 RepID=A0A2U1CQA3_9BURK|nr:helix-turn-helix domain-containing protein [Pusillimonas noertemannii]NYT67351.1 helix-turn-helix domain-containing protein [Pusillimonas noertemannii]PVY68024.1 AraC-like protein [Pusillimonas noertemannii]TFL12464.1 helix-turn-helix domain-containing protein [Pusillimonas noertemannii]